MAGPTWGAAGTTLSGSSATTAEFAVPSGVVADSVIVVVLHRDLTGASYETVTPPSGFTLVPDNPGRTTATFHSPCTDVFWKRATGADSGTYDFSWTSSFFRLGVALRLDGCKTSGNPFEADDGAVSSTETTTTPPVSVTTLGADRLLLWTGATWDGPGGWTQPSGFTARVTNADFDLFTVSSKAQAAAGSSGSVVGTQRTSPHTAWLGAFLADEAAVAVTGVCSVGLAATGTAKKVAQVGGSCGLALAATGHAVKRALPTGPATVGVWATGKAAHGASGGASAGFTAAGLLGRVATTSGVTVVAVIVTGSTKAAQVGVLTAGTPVVLPGLTAGTPVAL